MPRCYMVRKEKGRLLNPPPCSPTEACIPPPYTSPAEDPALLDPAASEDTVIEKTDAATQAADYEDTPTERTDAYTQVTDSEDTPTERTDADTQAALNLLELSRSTPSVTNNVAPVVVQPQIICPFYTVFPSIPIQQTYPPLSVYPVFGGYIQQTPFVDTTLFALNSNYPSEQPQVCIEELIPNETEDTLEEKETKDACVGTEMRVLKYYGKLKFKKTEPSFKKLPCSDCGKLYTTPSSLARHKQTHRSIDSGLAKHCYECGKAYVSTSAYSMHMKTHTKTYNCSMCDKTFSRQWLLTSHQRTHNGVKPYICVCGKSFSDRSNYRVHQQTHSTQKLYNCKKCGKQFKLKMHAKRHMDKVSCTPNSLTTNHFPLNFYTPL